MRLLAKLIVCILTLILFLGIIAFSWVFIYSRDLPDVRAIVQFAPTNAAQVTYPCSDNPVTAIPFNSIGTNLRAALVATEASDSDPGVVAELTEALRHDDHSRNVTLSLQISRMLFCRQSHALSQQSDEIRAAIRIERHYSHSELLTIYANMAYFGEGLTGIQAASRRYFEKDPANLSIPEAALLAGLLQGPSYYSPVKHPARALRRRDDVIDVMIANGSISSSEGENAKTAPLITSGVGALKNQP